MSSHSFFFPFPHFHIFLYIIFPSTHVHVTSHTSHKSHPFFFSSSIFLTTYSHTPSPSHISHLCPLFSCFPQYSSFLCTVHSFTGFVHSSSIFLNLLLFPTHVHVHEPEFAVEFLFFFLRCHWGLLLIFAEFVEK